MFASTMAYIVVGQPLLDLLFALPICGRAIGPPYLLAKGEPMSATVIQMNEALADGEELVTFAQAGTLVANETEALRDGLNIANFAVQFIPKAPTPTPTPPAPNPPAPVPSPILAMNANQKANAIATVQKLHKTCELHSVKPGQQGSMLTVALAELFVLIKPYVAAWLASLLNPTPPTPPATK